MKKALGWFRVALFTLDTGTDLYVAVDLINRCHYRYASAVLCFFWLPGLFIGAFSASIFVKEKCPHELGCCAFLLGTIFGPLVFLPTGLYYLVKAAINPDASKDVEGALR